MKLLGLGNSVEVSGYKGKVTKITARRVEGKLMPLVGVKVAGREIFVDGKTIENALDKAA